MWDLVSGLLKDPEKLKAGIEAMVEAERTGMRGDPGQESKVWLEKLSDVDQERRGYLQLAAKGRVSDGELDEALAELEDTRQTAERALHALRDHQVTIEQLERDRDVLLESYARWLCPNWSVWIRRSVIRSTRCSASRWSSAQMALWK